MRAQDNKAQARTAATLQQEGRAIANSGNDRSINTSQELAFSDSRPDSVAQAKLLHQIENGSTASTGTVGITSDVIQRAISHTTSGNVDTYTGTRKDFWSIGSDPYQDPTNGYAPKKYRAAYDVNGDTGNSGWYNNPAVVSWDRGHKLAKNTGGRGYADNLFWQEPATNRGSWARWESNFDDALSTASNTDPVTFEFERGASDRDWLLTQW